MHLHILGICGTFMGGMCLGSLLLPRWVSSRHHPLKAYAYLELAIGAAGPPARPLRPPRPPEGAGPPPPLAAPGHSAIRNFALRVMVYSTGAPLSGAKVHFTLDYFGGKYRQQKVFNGPEGLAEIQDETLHLKRLAYPAQKPHLLTLHVTAYEQENPRTG